MIQHIIKVENAPKIWDWFKLRGGIAVWKSANLSNPGMTWTTPVRDKNGELYRKPTWQAANDPVIITDPDCVMVSEGVLVKRFHVALRVSGNGLMLKYTDASSRRVHKAVEKAGEGAYFEFDYESQDALIYAQGVTRSLIAWRDSLSRGG